MSRFVISVIESIVRIINFSEINSVPSDVHLVRISENTVLLRWKYPKDQDKCGLYFVVSGTIDDSSIQQIIDGSQREIRFDNSAVHWRLHIAAANELGTGPASVPVHLNSGHHGRLN